MRALLVGLVLSFSLAGCASTDPGADQQTNVSSESYRAALIRLDRNLDNVEATITQVQAADKDPNHDAPFWDAKHGLIRDSKALIADTLAGSRGPGK